jgi:hypothetical protein
MKKLIVLLFAVVLSYQCKKEEEQTTIFKYPFGVEGINKLTDTININKSLKIFKYGKKGDYGTYSDGTLQAPLYILKTYNKNSKIDSLVISMDVTGENARLIYDFEFKNKNELEVRKIEKWEDEETEELNILDSLFIYSILNNKINLKLKTLKRAKP